MERLSLSRSFVVLLLAVSVFMPLRAESQQPPVKFKLKTAYDSGGYGATSVALNDLNGDGHLDLIVANACPSVGCSNANEGEVSARLGKGDGTFQAPTNYASGGNRATSVAAGDLNGDGHPDLVVANRCRSGNDCDTDDTGEVSVLLGNGNGTFQAAVRYSSGGFSPTSVAIADVSHDGKPDLLIANHCQALECVARNRGAVGVLLGNGNGTFQAPVSYDSGGGLATSLAVGDLNGDGEVDVAVADRCVIIFDDDSCNSPVGVVGVLLGNGDGTFQTAVYYLSGGHDAGSVAIEDMNGDSHPDLVVTDIRTAGRGHAGVMLNNGNGTFQDAILRVAGPEAGPVAAEDLNGDGIPDMAVVSVCQNNQCTSGKVSFLAGIGGGDFTGVVSGALSSGVLAGGLAMGDINGDGRPDVVVTNFCADDQTCNGSGTSTVGVLLNSLILATTTTALTSSNNPVQVNQPVTLTATVSSSRPVRDGDIVTFSIGPTKIGTGTTTNGVATLATSFSVAKTYTIKASYPGFDYLGASSGTVKQVVHH